jgi:stearoyl-CoA desaturase (delta-9 desaturase)
MSITAKSDKERVITEETHNPAFGVLRGTRASRSRSISYSIVLSMVACGAIISIWWIVTFGISWIEVSAFILFYFLSSIGQGIGLHRYFSHKSFCTSKLIRFLLAFFAIMSVQGSIVEWVGDHRRHHFRTDKCGDPHSPRIDNHCLAISGWRGLLHAQIGWLFTDTSTDYTIFARDLLADRVVAFFSRTRLFWYFVSIVVLPGIYGYVFGGMQHAIGAILVGGMLRAAVFSQSVSALNSIAHTFGTVRFHNKDNSRNNAFLAMFTLGEGWHNNHHRFPRNAHTGHAWYEIDILGATISLMEEFGLVWNVVRNTRFDANAKTPLEVQETITQSGTDNIKSDNRIS